MKLIQKSLLLTLCLTSSLVFADVAVIVNTANDSQISDDDIQRMFLGKNKSFSNGESVVAINLDSGNEQRGEFEEKVLGKSSSQVKAYWSKLIFSGKAKPLEEVASDSEVISLISSTPNAIGYIDASKVDSSVKVVKTF
ncbi:phosphate ABC transporter substrate-binding protein [Colwellia echini]|uniref:Phosphate ABC transporter substrate-binding protein n=1 Tax=Colwellia echini TaxID=1982103 RepID=A0ABY3MU28_9GAMM|nr:phosphate ABC transporter substrate-binding protein [Colwellia echini]TYK64629.1 phosphate ABC transporter substrate-binding protein [Colwellia echini]